MKRSVVHALQALGVLVTIGASRIAYVEVFGPARYGNSDVSSAGWWVLLAGLVVVGGYSLGLPEHPRSRTEAFLRSSGAVAVGIAGLSLLQLLLAASLLPRSSLLLIASIVPLWSLLVWNVAVDVERWSTRRDRVLVITDRPQDVAALRADLEQRVEVNAAVVGVIDVDDARIRSDGSSPVAETLEDLDPTVIVLDRAAQNDDTVVEQVATAHRAGIRVRTLSLFYEEWLGKLPLSELAQVSMLFDIGEVHRVSYGRAKRVMDIAFGLLCCAALVVLTPLILIANLAGNRGPLLFRQERIGKHGVAFTMLKFRTMREGTDDQVWTEDHDPRVTSFGNLLRRLHVDELPQAINVLRGQLSIVGPRPEQTAYVEELRTKIPFYDERHIVRPGLTGWAQVKLGYTSSETDALEKLQYDFYYLRRQSITFDLRIVGRTLREIAGGLGR